MWAASSALDVAGRIDFGKAEFLRAGERDVVFFAAFHLRENVRARAVDHAAEGVDAIAGERIVEDADDRDRAAGRGFVAQRAPRACGEREEARALRGDQIFVGGDDRAAAFERVFEQFGRDRACRRCTR